MTGKDKILQMLTDNDNEKLIQFLDDSDNCPSKLGLKESCHLNCVDCWRVALEGEVES